MDESRWATWLEVLQDETKIGLHAALTPVWSETAWFADYVLPMGNAAERHDLMSRGDACPGAGLPSLGSQVAQRRVKVGPTGALDI